MVRCKLANDTSCGKDICCYTCADFNTCVSADKCGETFDNDDYDCPDKIYEGEITTLDQAIPEVLEAMQNLLVQKQVIDDKEAELKEQMKLAMEKYGIKSWKNNYFSVTYVAPTTRTSIDSTKLKKEHPDIAEQYSKTSPVKSSIRVKVNE